MKRLCSVFLTIALALGLMTPAVAVSTPEPDKSFSDGYYESYEAAYEEGTTKGKTDAGGTFGITKFFVDPGWEKWEDGTYEEGLAAGKEAGYQQGYLDAFFEDSYEKGSKAGYPVGLADAMADNDYANAPESLDQSDSANYTAENMYLIGFENGYWEGVKAGEEKRYQEDQKKASQERITEKGGTVGKINVMLNGTMIPFPDAFPELKNDRTMVPIWAIAKALNAQVEFLAGKVVKITRGDTVLTLTVGGNTVTATTGGVSKELKMDTVSYIKSDRTYVPVSFVSQALGLSVYWDNSHRTVVILDQKAIAAKLDEQFTVLNSYMARQATLYQTPKRIDSRFSVAVEVIDTINGNKTHTISGNMVSYAGDGAMTMDGTVDLTSLAALVKSFAARFGDTEDYSEMLKAFSAKQDFSVKVSPEGKMYLKMPMMGHLMALTGMETPEGEVWYDLGNPYGGAVPGLSADSATLGMILAQSAAGAPYSEPFYYYDTIMEAGDTVAALFGDGRFQKSGDTYTCTLTLDILGEVLGLDGESLAEMKAMFETFSFTIKFSANGSYSFQGKVKANMDEISSLVSGINLDLNQNGTDQGDSAKILLQLRNLMNITMTGSNTINSTTQKPNYKLPDGAVIVDLGAFR